MSKQQGQDFSLPIANGLFAAPRQRSLMGRKRKKLNRKRGESPNGLFIGEWMDVLGLQQNKVAARAGVSEPYLSQLISGTRTNPGFAMLSAIAGAMEIDWGLLTSPPPDAKTIDTLQGMPPSLIKRLSRSS